MVGTRVRGQYGGKDRHSPLRETSLNRERRERYHASRLATEVALLKFNTPYEKREHSPATTFENKTRSTAINSSWVGSSQTNNKCTYERVRGRSPLQDVAYRVSPDRRSGHRHQTPSKPSCEPTAGYRHQEQRSSVSRPNTLLPSSSAAVLTRSYAERSAVGDKYSPRRSSAIGMSTSGANGY